MAHHPDIQTKLGGSDYSWEEIDEKEYRPHFDFGPGKPANDKRAAFIEKHRKKGGEFIH